MVFRRRKAAILHILSKVHYPPRPVEAKGNSWNLVKNVQFES